MIKRIVGRLDVLIGLILAKKKDEDDGGRIQPWQAMTTCGDRTFTVVLTDFRT